MMTLTLIIPVYNETKRIYTCIRALTSFKPSKGLLIDHVIFVNDGSTDYTLNILKQLRLPYPVKVVSYLQNKGRGYAVKEGMKYATGDYALFFDVDMSTPLTEINHFLTFMQKGADVIVGSRKIPGAQVKKQQPWYRTLLGRGFSSLAKWILRTPVNDYTCGFKAYSKTAYQTIFPISQINGWGKDSESLFLADKLGFSIVELPVVWIDNRNSKVKIVRDIFRSIIDLYQIRSNYYHGKYTYIRGNSLTFYPAFQK